MVYDPTVWVDSSEPDIDAEHLNKIEQALVVIFQAVGQMQGQLIAKSQIINNLLATTPGNVLDAMQGKNLKDQIDTLNLDLKSVGIFVTSLASTLTLGNGETLIPIDVTQVNDSSGNYTASGGAINISKPGVYIINAMAHGVLNPGDFVGVYLRTSNLSAYDNTAQTISNANSAAQQFLLNFSAIVKVAASTNVYLVGTSAMGNATIFPRTVSPGTQIRIARLC